MLGSLINWITKKSGWRTIVWVSVVVLIVFGIATGVIYYIFGGASLFGFERLFTLFDKDKKAREAIEDERKDAAVREYKRFKQGEREFEKKRKEEEKERLEKMPKEKTAEEIKKEIEDLLDKEKPS